MYNNLKVLLCFCLICLCCSKGFSQTNFKSGYVITNDNDIIYGFIDSRLSKKQVNVCSFKTGPDAPVIKFYPGHIKAYRFENGKFFVSKKVLLNGSENVLFWEYLVHGTTSLYFHLNDDGGHFLIEKEDGVAQVLSKENRKVRDGNATYYEKNNKYKGILKVLFNEAAPLSKDIDAAILNHKSLTKIVRGYHQYVTGNDDYIVYEEKLPSIIMKFTPTLGLNMARMTFFDYSLYGNFIFSPSLFPTVGFTLNTFYPRINERFSIEADVDLGKLYFNDHIERREGVYYIRDEAFLSTYFIRPFLSLKYNYPKGRMRPHVSIGGGSYVFVNQDHLRKNKRVSSSSESDQEFKDLILPQHVIATGIRTGFTYGLRKNKAIFCQFKYDYVARSFSAATEINTIKNMQSFTLVSGFSF